MVNIPIYRAKKIDSDEWVEGYYFFTKAYGTHKIYPVGKDYKEIKIYPNTLSIHFPNMLDKNGKKIFASLSKDGVGGDKVMTIFSGTKGIAVFDGNKFLFSHDAVVVIGIYKGLSDDQDQLSDNIDRPERHNIGGSMNRPSDTQEEAYKKDE